MNKITLVIAQILLTLSPAFVYAQGQGSVADATELASLKDFYHSTNGAGWKDRSGWPTTEAEWADITSVDQVAHWKGLTIEGGDVISLSFDNNQLTGSLPSSIAELAALQNIYLSENVLTGTIPTSIGRLRELKTLFLSVNKLTGTIPPELGNLAKLTRLVLNDNQLTGTIPTELANLTKLFDLYLSANRLSGTIPTELGNLSNLTLLFLNTNQLSGTIPVELSKLDKLTYLYLYQNQLTGAIPPELGKLSNLQNLNMYANKLTGTIPVELASLTKMERLGLHYNQLTGTIPAEVGNMPNLQHLFVHYNQLSGSIPNNFSQLPKLISLYAHHNQLSTIPDLSKHPNKAALQIAIEHNRIPQFYIEPNLNEDSTHNFNTFTYSPQQAPIINGLVPDATELSALKDFYHSTNGTDWKDRSGWPTTEAEWADITSVDQVAHWKGLTIEDGDVISLSFDNNQLTGSLPSSIAELAVLQNIYLPENVLTGPIPPAIGTLRELKTLFLSVNKLTGTIPPELGNLAKLTRLVLNNNQLTGTIPTELANLTKLFDLYLSANRLSGTIPTELGNLSNLTLLFLNTNQLSGTIPVELSKLSKLTYLYLYQNQLTGSIPPELGKLTNLQNLNLYANKLTGTIPVELASLTKMERLGLHYNQLTGTIPAELGNMSNLQHLFVHYNQLSGSIPNNFSQLPKLISLYAHHNQLSIIADLSEHPLRSKLNYQVHHNQLSFATIEANLAGPDTHPFKNFTYHGQTTTTTAPTLSNNPVITGTSFTIYSHGPAPHNTFRWEKQASDGTWTDITTSNTHATGGQYSKTASTPDAGTYRYIVTNSWVVGQSKAAEPLEITITDRKKVVLDQWIFQYRYDHRNRMIEKQIPGAGTLFMIYDDRDRLVLTQDANQRLHHQWTFTKYDTLNRPISTGVYTDPDQLDRDLMQEKANAFYTDGGLWYETTANPTVHGYTNQSFPDMPNESDYLTVTYYDNYQWNNDAKYAYQRPATYSYEEQPVTSVKGQITGTKIKTLGTADFLKSVSYYDNRHHIIQTVTQNHIGGIDRISNLYDSTGKVLETITKHGDATNSQSIKRNFAYDHAGRLLKVEHKLNEQPQVTLVENQYNELGELIDKKLHSQDQGNTFEQSIDYRYNTRGELTSINDAALSENEINAPKDYFGVELTYTQDFESKDTLLYRISTMKWSGDQGQSAYSYQYDSMNRLTEAQYHTATANSWDNTNDFTIKGVSYDFNGNIEQLTRYHQNGIVDQLTYDYGTGIAKSNQLLSVTDTAPATTKGQGFNDGNTTGNDYAYDANGNMITDRNKGIHTITYNHLNLPEKVIKADGQYIRYIYDATGIKLAQEVYGPKNELRKRTDYVGEFIYEQEGYQARKLAIIQHEEGRIVPDPVDDGLFSYEYALKDHLGNTRVMFTTAPKTHQFKLNYESDQNNADDQELFEKTGNIVDANIHDRTDQGPTYSKSQKLTGDSGAIIGSVLTIPVGKGDKVTAQVYAKYFAPTATSNPVNSVTATLVGALSGNSTAANFEGAANSITTDFGGSFIEALGHGVSSSEPKAFINLMFLTEKATEVGAFTYKQVSPASNNVHALLELDQPFEAPSSGHVVIYLSNESSLLTEVYFDDLQITVNESKIIQRDDYDPFGLTFNSYKRSTARQNKLNTFQEQELVTDLNLNWIQFKWRNHQPEIGRFFNIDPLAEDYYYSPYAFSEPGLMSTVELKEFEKFRITNYSKIQSDKKTE